MQSGFLVEELMLPYFFLSFPVHDITLLHRASKRNVAKILAFFKIGSNVHLSFSIASQTIGDDARGVCGCRGRESSLDCMRTVVNDEGPLWWRRSR